MSRSKTLPPGRAFEKKIFGVTEGFGADLGLFTRPDYFDFKSSLEQVIEANWAMFAESWERGENIFHNPTKPGMGRTHSLWEAVKNWLPSRLDGQSNLPLNLYVALGRNSLDHHHGVDAFFWWQGVYATIDASTRRKKELLKADFLFTPKDLQHDRLLAFGKKVAELLIERNSELGKCKAG